MGSLLSEKEKKQRMRERGARLLEALKHAARCKDKACPIEACSRIKSMIAHFMNCKIKISGGCQECKRFLHMVQVHKRRCTDGQECQVPFCAEYQRYTEKRREAHQYRRRLHSMNEDNVPSDSSRSSSPDQNTV